MMIIVKPDNIGIQQSVLALKNNQVVAYPTETVYGLAVNPFSEEAVENLFNVKGRDENKPVLLVIGDLEQLDEIVISVSDKAKRYIDKFWPGPLSLVLPVGQTIPKRLTAGKEKISVRWTSHPVAQKLALEFGHAITSTSANRSGEPPAKSISELPDGISIVIEDKFPVKSEVSTVFDPDTGEVFREGMIKKEELIKILNE